MARSTRVQRSVADLICALDHHQYLLRENLHGLQHDPAYTKTIASELRTLVCLSTGTEGLLWRLVDELGISDVIILEGGGTVNRDHPLNYGKALWAIPLNRPGQGPPGFPPEPCSLRHVIKNYEAIYVAAINDRVLTHELLIGAIAGQMGGAHEAEGLEPSLITLNRIFINERAVFARTLAFDAGLVLQISERVLDRAEKALTYTRASRPRNKGDVSLDVRFGFKQLLAGRQKLLTFRSEISEVEITCSAGPQSAVFEAFKRGDRVCELIAPYPPEWQSGQDVVFVFSYSSATRKARTITNFNAAEPTSCDLGWSDARELCPPAGTDNLQEFVNFRWVGAYERLISSQECGQLSQLSADAREVMLTVPRTGAFPP